MADYTDVPDEIDIPAGRHTLTIMEVKRNNSKKSGRPMVIFSFENPAGQTRDFLVMDDDVRGKSEIKRMARACGFEDEDFKDFKPEDMRDKSFSAVVSINGNFISLSDMARVEQAPRREKSDMPAATKEDTELPF